MSRERRNQMGVRIKRRGGVYAATALAAAAAFGPATALAGPRVQHGGGDNNYATPPNWASTVAGENDNVPDAAGEVAVIRNGFTVDLSAVVSPNELQLSRGGSTDFPQTTTGTALLNV